MGMGFGFFKEVQKTMKQNRAMLDDAKSSFERRKNVKLAKNKELKFNELSKEELAQFSKGLEEKRVKKDRRSRKIMLIGISITILIISYFALLGYEFNPPTFEPIAGFEKSIETKADGLVGAYKVGEYSVFKKLWKGDIKLEASLDQTKLHLFIREHSARVILDGIRFGETDAIVKFSFIGNDSIVTTSNRFRIFNGKPVITDFAFGELPILVEE